MVPSDPTPGLKLLKFKAPKRKARDTSDADTQNQSGDTAVLQLLSMFRIGTAFDRLQPKLELLRTTGCRSLDDMLQKLSEEAERTLDVWIKQYVNPKARVVRERRTKRGAWSYRVCLREVPLKMPPSAWTADDARVVIADTTRAADSINEIVVNSSYFDVEVVVVAEPYRFSYRLPNWFVSQLSEEAKAVFRSYPQTDERTANKQSAQ